MKGKTTSCFSLPLSFSALNRSCADLFCPRAHSVDSYMHACTDARTHVHHTRTTPVAQHTLHKPQHQHNSLLALCKQRLHCVPRLRSHTGRPLKRTKRKHSETDVSGAPSLSVPSFSAVVCVCPVAYYRWAGTNCSELVPSRNQTYQRMRSAVHAVQYEMCRAAYPGSNKGLHNRNFIF